MRSISFHKFFTAVFADRDSLAEDPHIIAADMFDAVHVDEKGRVTAKNGRPLRLLCILTMVCPLGIA